jgi:hypothetical protein
MNILKPAAKVQNNGCADRSLARRSDFQIQPRLRKLFSNFYQIPALLIIPKYISHYLSYSYFCLYKRKKKLFSKKLKNFLKRY